MSLVSTEVKKLIKKHKLNMKDFVAFMEEKYGNFPVDETTVAQHFIQSQGIKLEFPEYGVRGIPRKIRQLKQDEFPVITVAIGPEMVEPRTYIGCKVETCFSSLKDGNCSKKDGGHGFQGETGAPTYTTHSYKVSDGTHPKKDTIVAVCRHDVNDGKPISGVWKLKGILNDNGEFYCWAGLEVTKKELEDWIEEEGTIVGGEEEEGPDLSYLDDDEEKGAPEVPEEEVPSGEDVLAVAEEKGITPEEAEGGIPPAIVEKFKNIMANEKKLSVDKLRTWLTGKGYGSDEDFQICLKVTECEVIGEDVIAPWAVEKENESQ